MSRCAVLIEKVVGGAATGAQLVRDLVMPRRFGVAPRGRPLAQRPRQVDEREGCGAIQIGHNNSCLRRLPLNVEMRRRGGLGLLTARK